jgi:CRISPR-associated protein Csd1
MSWIQKLYETYEACAGNKNIPDSGDLFPVSHTTQQAHIEITIDKKGIFKDAKVIANKPDQKTLIPCTEKSAGKSGIKPVNHPLCDKLQYIAGDFTIFNGIVTRGFINDPTEPFRMYHEMLTKWCNSTHKHEMVCSILAYINKKHVIQDLVDVGILSLDHESREKQILLEWKGEKEKTPLIFRVLPPGQTPMDSFIRFRVLSRDLLESGTWESLSLIQSWIGYYASIQSKRGLCFVSGKEDTLAEQHPAKLRHDADKAKLISSNDNSGYTFKGRFIDADQVVGVSFEATQKAHNALRWLIRRKQAFRSDTQVFVSWAVRGTDIPPLCVNTLDFLGQQEEIPENKGAGIGDVGQSFATRLNKKIAGYRTNITDSENIVIMGLDSATPGRMAITFYRELTGSEFLQRIEQWHSDFSWEQNYGKDLHFIGAPAPKDIAWTAFGIKVEGKNGIKLLNATVERLLPCIVDNVKLPKDLVLSSVRRVSNRIGLKHWEWEKSLGIACSLYKGINKDNKERRYEMSLEENRKTRDYLYGRLLAVGEQVESMALYYAGETRETNAARLMQRFSDRPFSTWKLIENSLVPYKARINSKTPGLLAGYKELLDGIHSLFTGDEYVSDKRLSGEYLLGYHCQRKWLHAHKREKGKWVEKTATDSENPESVEALTIHTYKEK